VVVAAAAARAISLIGVRDLGDVVSNDLPSNALGAVIVVVVVAAAVPVVDHLETALVLKLSDALVADFGSEVNELADLILLEVLKDIEVELSLLVWVTHLLDSVEGNKFLGNLRQELSRHSP